MGRSSKWCIATAAVAVAIYAVLWLGFALHWQWLATIDSAMLNPLHAYGVKHPAWVRFWDVLCAVLSPDGFRVVGLVAVVLAVARRNVRVILFLLTTIGLSGIVSQLAKNLADRPRPTSALTTAASTAFPSGHAVGAITAVLALLTISAGVFSRRARIVTIVLGAVMVIAVGVGRVVLSVHYPSDVVAGWALGYLWYLGCLLVIRPPPLTEAADETREAPDTER